jgi:hypothetical protein
MSTHKNESWAGLAAEDEVWLAVDTEFEGTETLTIQFAVRVGDRVRVQIYHAPDIPPPPPDCFGKTFTDRFPEQVEVLPAKVVSPDLSPGRVLADLLGLPHADFLSRHEGDALRQGQADDHDPRRRGLRSGKKQRQRSPDSHPRINVTLIAHFLRADLLRAFGRDFYGGLLAPRDQNPAVAIRDGRVIGFIGTGGAADVFNDPVVEYVRHKGLYELRLGTLDTNCVCGPSKLDALARAYLGLEKNSSITEAEKARMKEVFLDPRRAADAYRYAAHDAVLTLLVAEKMRRQHGELYAKFSIPSEHVPPMHGTPGLRVANLILRDVCHRTAAGSSLLGSKEGSAAGINKLKTLAGGGSADALSDGRVSRFGRQTGDTHGGLLQSRTPFQFFHEAEGQFRDLDLKSCYPTIIRPMFIYIGRPLVLEPGHTTWTLKDAVQYLRQHADGEYAWYVKASGPVEGFANTLISSTVNALTNDNYRGRDRSRAARRANVAMLDRKNRDWCKERVADRKYTALLTDEVNAGVVTYATWLMIQALPRAARQQYEHLRAETVVFYPKKLAASDGTEYDALVEKYRRGDHAVDWRQELDLDDMTRTTTEDIDDKYVSLRYTVGKLTSQLVDLREKAGKDTAAGLLYKTLANTVYGAFASPFLPTSNPVAANVITGTARALAYAMMLSLNAHLVITDGVLYRRDRVPDGTFADRLRRTPDYPLLHAKDGPFLNPRAVPKSDTSFTDWYVGHVRKFFGVERRPEYESLFRLHALAHKTLPEGGLEFDGACIDGSANYLKLLRTRDGQWRVADMKARSFGPREKERLNPKLLRMYASNKFIAPLPAVPSGRLLTASDALAQVGQAFKALLCGAAVVPLGLKLPSLSVYKPIKSSAFVFRTARQRERVLKEWGRLLRKTECGLELLALRRTFKGSLMAVAKRLFELIRRGEERMNGLNIDKLWRPKSVGLRHGEEVSLRRDRGRKKFWMSLAVTADDAAHPTGLIVDPRSLASVQEAAQNAR